MLITGPIAKVEPPDFRDQYGNSYQNITIQTVSGPVLGRKASKTPYAVQDIGRQVSWDCNQQTSSRGPYNKFTKPQDPQYVQPGAQQGQQAPQQGGYRPNAPQARDYNAENRGKVRNTLVGAAIQAGQIVLNENNQISDLNYWVEYIMTGNAPLPPAAQGDYPPPDEGGQIPPTDDNIPY